jgi:hypothetical protein
MNTKPAIYLMGNAHLDPAWLWRWQEGYGEVKSTFRSALDRMKEFDDYVFTASSACYYKWLEEDEPEMFEEIRERVREGRWALVGCLIAPRPVCFESGVGDFGFLPEVAEREFERVKQCYEVAGVPEQAVLDSFSGGHEWHGTVGVPMMESFLKGEC